MSSEYELDDEYEHHAYRVGRPTRTVEVDAPDGTTTIEEGALTFDLCHKHDLHDTREQDGWVCYYVAPDGGVGFGLGENSGGVTLTYDLVGIIELPEPMTEKEADEWLTEERMLEYSSGLIESDVTAEDILDEIR